MGELNRRGVPRPSRRKEDLLARTVAAEHARLWRELEGGARLGPEALMERLRSLTGQRGVDTGRLRERLNEQLAAETKRLLQALIRDGGAELRDRLGSMSLPALQVFGERIGEIRRLYLDDAVARVVGEQDDLKRSFLERLTRWVEQGGELDVRELVSQMKETSTRRARFFARDQFSRLNRSVAVASYQEAGAEYIEWVTAGDVRVRPEHKARNHRVYTQAELEADPEWKSYNCRCGFVPLWDLTDAQRRRRVA